MVSANVQAVLDKLNSQFKKIETMKVYTDRVPINKKIELLKQLPVRIRGTASLIYDALEGHVNTEFKVYASQETIAKETGYTREHVNYILGLLHKIGLIEKIRRGVQKVNEYILIMKKEMIAILEEKTVIENSEKNDNKKSSNRKQKFKIDKPSTWNYDGQRQPDFKEIERLARENLEVG